MKISDPRGPRPLLPLLLEDALVSEGGWGLLAVKPPVNLSATKPRARDSNRAAQASLMGLPRLS